MLFARGREVWREANLLLKISLEHHSGLDGTLDGTAGLHSYESLGINPNLDFTIFRFLTAQTYFFSHYEKT